MLKAALNAGRQGLAAHATSEPAVGTAIQNNFGLLIGPVALRYSSSRVQACVPRWCATWRSTVFGVFVAASFLATLLLGWGDAQSGTRSGQRRAGAARRRRQPGRRLGAAQPDGRRAGALPEDGAPGRGADRRNFAAA